MVNQSHVLDEVFGALASGVRRQTLEALGSGPRSASELAAAHAMTLSGFMKHLHVLSAAGLVTCTKDGRTVTCALTGGSLSKASHWLHSRERTLNARLDALGRHLYHQAQIQASGPSPVPGKRGRR
jgi:DNA-binding transcriptional ArsR family regulator